MTRAGLWVHVHTGMPVYGPIAPEELPWEMLADIRLSNEELDGIRYRLRLRAGDSFTADLVYARVRAVAGSRAPRLQRRD